MDPSDPDWLGASRRAAAAVAALLARPSSQAERVAETGSIGGGGDRTLEIDASAEDAVFAELDALHAAGARFTALSEERGEVDYGSPGTLVVIDPIDGSVNAKRRLPHHALSIAVATGPTMADVTFGFVHDFGPREEWVATRGGGAWLDGERIEPLEERRNRRGKLEVVGFESANPTTLVAAAPALGDVAGRVRAIGAIAISLCQVAAGRLDGMVSLRRCRAVDAAAGQLIVREGGGLVAFPRFEDPLGAPLDLAGHSPVVAARSEQGVAELARVPSWDED